MSELYPLVAASSRVLCFFAAVLLFLAAMMALFGWMAYGSMTSRVEVSDAGVRVRSPIYGQLIPAAMVRGRDARVVNLSDDRALRLAGRTNGIGLPGYAAGWFRLRDGGRALVFLTARERVVHIPTRDGVQLLVSVRDPEALLRSLQRFPGDGP